MYTWWPQDLCDGKKKKRNICNFPECFEKKVSKKKKTFLVDETYFCFIRRRPRQCTKKSGVMRGGSGPLHAVSRLRSGKTPASDARLSLSAGNWPRFLKRCQCFLGPSSFSSNSYAKHSVPRLCVFLWKGKKKEKKQADHMCIQSVYFTQWGLTNGGGNYL